MPARRLLVAIVRRALLDFVLYRDCSAEREPLRYELAADAAGWLFSDGLDGREVEGRYTFLHICALLGLDAGRVRDQALALTRDDLHRFNGDGPF